MEENDKNNKNEKNNENKQEIIENAKNTKNIEFLIEEIKKKDELIDNLQKENNELIKKNAEEISLLKNVINELKNKNEKEINDLKKLIEQKLNIKEEEENNINNINNINNENYDIINNKDDYEINTNKMEKNDIESIKDLSDKYNNFENKLDLIQKSLSKLMIKEGIEKDYGKEFENQLDKIFKKQNDIFTHIEKKDLEELKAISMELMKKEGPSPLERTRNYFEKKIKKRINETNDKNIISNLAIKQNEIFECLDNLELELNFNIPKFRKEFNLPKEDYTDEFLLLKCKENNWDKNKAFCDIINQNYS